MRGEKAAVPGRWEEPLPVTSVHLERGICSLIPQMYVQHDIYDLIFKYVGTMEASEVGPKSPSASLGASF